MSTLCYWKIRVYFAEKDSKWDISQGDVATSERIHTDVARPMKGCHWGMLATSRLQSRSTVNYLF